MQCKLALFSVLGLTLWSAALNAQSIHDLLKDAVEEYVDRKSEEIGLNSEKSEGTENKGESIQKVSLSFKGITPGEPDVFQSLHGNFPVPSSGSTGNTAAEKSCFALVQDKMAWNYTGTKHWSSNSIINLCKGTTQPTQPPNCFSRAMFNGNQWGRQASHKMTWTLASRLCAGTNNSNQKISCLKQKIGQNKSLAAAISSCGSGGTPYVISPVQVYNSSTVLTAVKRTPAIIAKAEKDCFQYVQGNIAWDSAGKVKKWGANNIKKLCKGTTSKYSPGNCFKYVLRSPDSWGKKPSHSVDWRSALDLCEGTSNANTTTGCFKAAIGSGKSVNQSVRQCEV